VESNTGDDVTVDTIVLVGANEHGSVTHPENTNFTGTTYA
jgi:hypothetical protein